MAVWIEYNLRDFVASEVTKRWPEKSVRGEWRPGSWQRNRFIQISTPIDHSYIHYEITSNRVALHFEESPNYDLEKYTELIDYLEHETECDNRFEWSNFLGGNSICCTFCQEIVDWGNLIELLEIVIKFFDDKILHFQNNSAADLSKDIAVSDFAPQFSSLVDLEIDKLEKVFTFSLKIPDYQRIYCWEDSNVKCLLDDLVEHLTHHSGQTPYRLGTIILHYHDNHYDIIDGQQRLVTLSLILHEMGINTCLMHEKFSSSEARQYISYNKHIISDYIGKHVVDRKAFVQSILSRIEMSVLILKNASLDLAYTFFSNENSRGVTLTDYDLLKAHHLRYIPQTFEMQSQKAAETWNKMIEQGRKDVDEIDSRPDYDRTLDTFIFYLRQWMRKKDVMTYPDDRHVKKEYEAAAVMAEIPPFGERFYFNEPIQGGTHFFSFVELQLAKYKQLANTEVYKSIHSHFSDYGSCVWYRDVAEALLFAYYQKFGEQCLADAAMLILRILLQNRYDSDRALRGSVSSYVSDLGLVLMIDQATSPTFFIAEAFNLCRDFPIKHMQDMRPIQKRMRQYVIDVKREISSLVFVESIKNIRL